MILTSALIATAGAFVAKQSWSALNRYVINPLSEKSKVLNFIDNSVDRAGRGIATALKTLGGAIGGAIITNAGLKAAGIDKGRKALTIAGGVGAGALTYSLVKDKKKSLDEIDASQASSRFLDMIESIGGKKS